jgi:hypothetical protein
LRLFDGTLSTAIRQALFRIEVKKGGEASIPELTALVIGVSSKSRLF